MENNSADVLWAGRPAARRYFLGRQIWAGGLPLLLISGLLYWMHTTSTNPVLRKDLGLAAGVGTVFFLVSLGFHYVTYKSLAYQVHRQGIEFSHGILSRDQKLLLWSQVRSVELQRGLVDRLFSTGTIRFSTGEVLRNDSLTAVSGAEDVYRLIQQAMAGARLPSKL